MKYIYCFVFIALAFMSCKNETDPESETFNLKDCNHTDSITRNAEQIITRASGYCLLVSKKTDSLYSVLNLIKSAAPAPSGSMLLHNYWIGFCYMHIAICQMNFKEDQKADSTLQYALDLLNGEKKKNSEVYALLALMQGMSINYKSAMTLTVAAEKCKLYSEKAIKLNKNNPRGYLAQAIYDFYTPEIYQGGKLVEKNLTKALGLDEKTDSHISCLPGWGKDLCYRYLIKFYIKNRKPELAKKYIKEANGLYPDDVFFRNLQNESK